MMPLGLVLVILVIVGFALFVRGVADNSQETAFAGWAIVFLTMLVSVVFYLTGLIG